ncbi:MAG: Rrf2 family transcriptional regulator [Gemmataceae bacterium]|nr:Rrf2 family transcriptional regulator [Gemmataceae bacterium]
MVLLSRKCDYALLLLCYLHHKTHGASAREIADHFGISRPFVANILKDLCHKGFVVSHRGVRGGYELSPATADATLADVLDSLEDERIRLAECNEPPPGRCCALTETCPIRRPIEMIHRRLREVLQSVKLANLFGLTATMELGTSRCNHPSSPVPSVP